MRLQPGHRPERRRLGHAPGVDHAEPVPLLEPLDHRLRRGRAADDHGLDRGGVPGARVAIQLVEDAQPDGGNPGGERHLLVLEQLEQALGVEVGPREDLLRPHHGGGEGQAPGVHVEHGDHREHGVAEREAERVGQRGHHRVQDQRTVGVDDALGASGGARGVAEPGRLPLLEVREGEGVHLRLDHLLVVEREVGSGVPVGPDHHRAQVHVLVESLVDGEEHVVHQQEPILGVVHDVGEVLAREAGVERVQDAPGQRDGEVGLQVAGVVPAQRGDAVTGLQAQAHQRVGQLLHPLVELPVGRALDRLVGPSGDDLDVGEVLPGAIEDREQRQLVVHHQSAHGSLRWGAGGGVGRPR